MQSGYNKNNYVLVTRNELYTRAVEKCPECFVQNGKPVFGTFAGHPKRLDIRGVAKAYTDLPVPKVLTNMRIKSRLSYFFNLGEFIGCVDFFDAKIFGYADFTFWNTATKKKYVYHTVMGPRRRFVPHRLESASTSCYKKRRYIRISWDRLHNKLSVLFNLHGGIHTPSAKGTFVSPFDSPSFSELTSVLPSPTMRRCTARYNACFPLHGSLSLENKGGSPQIMPESEGICFFDMNRTYMRFRSRGEYITGLSFLGGKVLAFRIEAPQENAVSPEKYNGNILFYDGKITPLPPVVITHHYGILNKWVIQDTENMIDLTFSPVSDNMNTISVMVLHTDYHTIYGTLDGALLTADGERLNLKAFPALTKKYAIRL